MGRKFLDYDLLEQLSQGESARVFRARAPNGVEVAVKVYTGTAKDDFGRFKREQRLLASLGTAEGYVPLIDGGESPNGPYIVMPFLAGGSLREPLIEGPLDIPDAIALGIRLAQTLGIAHERGIVHRDMKPENVLFDAKKTAYIADLGLAKHFRRDVMGGSQSLSISDEGDVLGTVGYMAPEQITGEPVTPATDIFSLGAILHECFTGRPAFSGNDLFELGQKILNARFDRINAIRDDVPVGVASVVETALSRDGKKRYADGKDFARALGRARHMA
ncbi:MAG TPA: serine/threonine-protein kinase [Planctomycetota bacterium]|nr:serine/threonine-protein kinase [Planctomycetota bacterium]